MFCVETWKYLFLVFFQGIFVAAIAFGVLVSISSDKIDDICASPQANLGRFTRDPDDCSRYFECGFDRKVSRRFVCWDNTLFNTTTQSCDAPKTVQCENVSKFAYRLQQQQLTCQLFHWKNRNQTPRMIHVQRWKASYVYHTPAIHGSIFCARMEWTKAIDVMSFIMESSFETNRTFTAYWFGIVISHSSVFSLSPSLQLLWRLPKCWYTSHTLREISHVLLSVRQRIPCGN